MKYSKTEVGQQAFKQRSPLLSARQRSAFILFDGTKTLDQVLAATAGLGVTQADVDHMLAEGLLAVSEPQPAAASARTPQVRYAEAWPIATRLTASLGLRGFKLNLAVEAASGYDELLALLPKIQEVLGPKACQELEQALKG
ncbi:MAG: hypothetical protein U9R55_09320 [Pseudomonadota bacterium]|jgi:hypothetical protein|uniref:hypothetical protein n=1 Tax=Curvibacter delicatus TaxID=80879 RepID=UPI000834F40F|nr:hypothetical protein [Curvibacter delicatus]MEA3394811.1 hypothetical protein [Pseudomonadota bacterium]